MLRSRNTLLLIALAAAALALIGVGTAWAACHSAYGTCYDDQSFNPGTTAIASGWRNIVGDAEVEEAKSFFNADRSEYIASGVLHTYQRWWEIRKTWRITQGGRYRLVGRVALYTTEDDFFYSQYRQLQVQLVRGSNYSDLGTFDVPKFRYIGFTTEAFEVTSAEELSIQISMVDGPGYYEGYFDYLWLVHENATPTPTGGTVYPTSTPIPAQATAMPTPSPYCRGVQATATPGPAQYPPPTATAVPADDWSFLEQFTDSIWRWVAVGSVGANDNLNHYTAAQGYQRSASIQYQPEIAASSTGVLTHALIFDDGYPTYPGYVDGWGRATNLPAGEQAYITVWALDDGTWEKQGQQEIGLGAWYPWHITVTQAVSITAIAITAWRTDDPASGTVVVDDVFMYGNIANRPYCDGSYGTTTIQIGPTPQPTSAGPGGRPTTITWPGDKPCPEPVSRPNNFWGGLLAELTVFLDRILAFTPQHDPQFSIATMTRDLIAGPAGTGVAVLGVFIDPTIPLVVIGAWLGLQVGQGIVAAWLWIKNLIPFL